MKKTKNLLLTAILVGLSSQVFAQDVSTLIANNPNVKNIEVNDYPGVNFPQPIIHSNKKTMNLDELLSNTLTERGAAAQKTDVSELRKQAINEIASALGASGGLAFRTAQIKKEIDAYGSQLDILYDFGKLIIDNGVLPPVLTEGLANYNQDSDDQVRIADKIYKIEAPAKFVSVYPTWRSYLRFSFPSYEMPDAAYLPKNASEKAYWDLAVKEGWDNGIRQANDIFETSYSRLERDYKGMIKYKILLTEGLVTPTVVAKQNLGITGGGREMSINDQIFRITDHSSLNPNKTDWKVEYPVSNNLGNQLK
jgi:defect-in-organelle-trafficking protein DotC